LSGGYEFVEAKYRELLRKLEDLRMRIAMLRAEVQSTERALKRLEELEGVEEVYEMAGHILIKRKREEVLEELRLNLDGMRSVLKGLEEERKKTEEELNRLIESVRTATS